MSATRAFTVTFDATTDEYFVFAGTSENGEMIDYFPARLGSPDAIGVKVGKAVTRFLKDPALFGEIRSNNDPEIWESAIEAEITIHDPFDDFEANRAERFATGH